MRLASDGRGEEESRDEYENRFHEKPPDAALQLRRAISIQAELKTLLEKNAIAPSAASAC